MEVPGCHGDIKQLKQQRARMVQNHQQENWHSLLAYIVTAF